MGDLQPGVGYNLVQSPMGDSLEILFPPQVPYGPEQFKVEMQGDNVKVAKGRVIAQVLTSAPTTMTTEYDVQRFAVYPTSKLTDGSFPSSPYCSDDGFVQIQKYTPGATEEDPPTGSNSWGVYLIRNVSNTSEVGAVVMPFLAVMADGSDAETKSKPWNTTGQHGDLREYYLIREKQAVEITQPGGAVVYGGLLVSQHTAVQRYNCQRLKIASLNWYDSTGWVVTQHLIGTLYLPNNVYYAGELEYEHDDPAPDVDWPLNSAENEDWSDAWTGYEKHFNDGGYNRTAEILV